MEEEKKCEEYLNGWKRSQADFINYKKDEIKRFEEVLKFGNEVLIRDILPVLDSLNLASAAEASREGGLSSIKRQLEDILRKNGVEEIVVKIGDQFDPKFHEAIVEVEDDLTLKSGQVAEEVEKGYTLHGKLIRPAKIKCQK